MKKIKNSKNVVLFFSAFILTGCYPVMHLTHEPETQGEKYSSKGKIRVLRFDDARPQKEIDGKGPKSRLKYQIPYKRTIPKFDEFIENSVGTEIRESGIFNIADYAEYELSGKITSFKCINKANGTTIAGNVLLGLFLCSAFIVDNSPSPETIPLSFFLFSGATLVSGMICEIAGKDKVAAIVSYDYVLKKNGKIITQNTINTIVNDKIKHKHNMEKSEIILDEALTQSIRKMLKEINEKVK